MHSIAEDGLPDMDELTGRVLFLWDGNIVSGWPLHVDPEDHSTAYSGLWEGNSDVSHGRPFSGVTHWIELPMTEWEIERGDVEAEILPPEIAALVDRARASGYAGYTRRERPRLREVSYEWAVRVHVSALREPLEEVARLLEAGHDEGLAKQRLEWWLQRRPDARPELVRRDVVTTRGPWQVVEQPKEQDKS